LYGITFHVYFPEFFNRNTGGNFLKYKKCFITRKGKASPKDQKGTHPQQGIKIARQIVKDIMGEVLGLPVNDNSCKQSSNII